MSTASTPRRLALLRLARTLGAGAGAGLATCTAWTKATSAPAATDQPEVRPGVRLGFPRDHGAHPAYRTEWWYLTGALQDTASAQRFGFQITFFRSRVDTARASHSAFAAHQLLFAHAALSDVQGQRLWHDQRIARAGLGLAEASTRDTHITLRDWRLGREGPPGQGVYLGQLAAKGFALDLRLRQTQPLLLQGQAGYSRKGPAPDAASFYYSQPQLATQGMVTLADRRYNVQGSAWLDHEWSETLLDAHAVGWDWVGMNLHDGGALMAFRLRRADGSSVWAGGTLRDARGRTQVFGPDEVRFTPGRRWTSPATGAAYPVQWQLVTPAGRYTVVARFDAQELDSRASTGGVYWEGLSALQDADGREVGEGYLEMTGYVAPLRL